MTPQEALKNQVFAEDLLQQPQVLEQFRILDEICAHTINLIMRHTNFVERNLADLVGEVAGGLTHGRTIYEKFKGEREEAPFKDGSEVRFLEYGITLVNIIATNREEAKSAARSVIDRMRFARLVFEESINSFMRLCEGYCSLSRQYVTLHCRLDTSSGDEAFRLATKLSDVHDRMDAIEKAVGVDREYLFHLIQSVETMWRSYLSTRDKIIRPYLRVAYKEARNRATTEEQVVENFQNGAQGLIRAVSCYIPRRKTNFSSYARWWVKQAILFRLKEDSNLVKLPATTWQAHTAIQKARAAVHIESDQEMEAHVAESTGMTVEKVRSVQDAVKASQMFSLDYPIDENSATLSQLLGSDHKFTKSNIEIDTQRRMTALPEDQRRIVSLYFGLFELVPALDDIELQDRLVEMLRQRLTYLRQL